MIHTVHFHFSNHDMTGSSGEGGQVIRADVEADDATDLIALIKKTLREEGFYTFVDDNRGAYVVVSATTLRYFAVKPLPPLPISPKQ